MGERFKLRLLGLNVCFFGFFWGSQIFADTGCNVGSPVTRDILQCANFSYKKIDRKLNEQYRGLVADSGLSNKKLLLESERAWVNFRDNSCNGIYESISPGEEAEIEKVGCRISLTSSRLMELVYLETGAIGDGFYSSLSIMSRITSKTREEILVHVESLYQHPDESEYYKKNCELTWLVFAEEERLCRVRLKFQSM